MRLATFTLLALLLSASCVLAQGTSNTMTSGRPSAVLDDATCQTIWQMASPNGATISQDQAVPYIVNFKMVGLEGRGKIWGGELKAAGGKGPGKKKKKKNLEEKRRALGNRARFFKSPQGLGGAPGGGAPPCPLQPQERTCSEPPL